jgi:putative two-component system response regulator
VVDAFESMTTTQFWREPMKFMEAASEIMESAGKRYDPAIVEAFRKALPLLKKVREAYNDSLGDMINLDFAPKTAEAAKTQKAAGRVDARVK